MMSTEMTTNAENGTEEVPLSEDSETTTLICDNCEESLNDIESYQCKTCASQNDGGVKSWFCEQCLAVLHIKKGHEICDYRGYKPKVCEKHRKLCLLFCDDCQIVFCDKCVGPHCKHQYRPASEKATDVRKSIFELLTNFEDLAKPVKRREYIEKNTFDERDKIAKSLDRENFESTLMTMITKVVHENVDHLYDVMFSTTDRRKEKTFDNTISAKNASLHRSELICSLSHRNDTEVIELRELLKSSDGACIEQFIDRAKLMEASLNEQRGPLKSHVYLQWNRSWENIILHSIRDAVKTIKVPSAETKTYKQMSLTPAENFNNFNNKCKELSPSELRLELGKSIGTCCFNVALNGDRVHSTVYHTNSCESENVVLTGIEVEFIGNDGRFAIVRNRSTNSSENEVQFIVDLSRKTMIETTAEENRALLNLDLREWKIVGFNASIFGIRDVYVWNEKRKAITTIHDIRFSSRNSQQKLVLMREVYTEPKLLFNFSYITVCVDKDERLIVEHKEYGTRIEVVKSQHQLSQIDWITYCPEEENKTLVYRLVDLKDRVVMECRANLTDDVSLSWEVLEVFKVDIPTTQTSKLDPLVTLTFVLKSFR